MQQQADSFLQPPIPVPQSPSSTSSSSCCIDSICCFNVFGHANLICNGFFQSELLHCGRKEKQPSADRKRRTICTASSWENVPGHGQLCAAGDSDVHHVRRGYEPGRHYQGDSTVFRSLDFKPSLHPFHFFDALPHFYRNLEQHIPSADQQCRKGNCPGNPDRCAPDCHIPHSCLVSESFFCWLP